MDKKKIGILTFHRFINYGGILQAYALCEKLNDLGYDTCVIDYRCENLENVGNSKLFQKNVSFGRNIKKICSLIDLKKKEKSFSDFISQNIPLSEAYYSKEELKASEEKYNLFITGSDQVWNPKWPYDGAYFLDFVIDPDKKISYGASLGDKKIEDLKKEEYRKRLETYKAISVREKSDKEALEKLLERECTLSLDPVLLLDKEEWEKVGNNKFNNKKYCLIYTVNEPENLIEKAKNYAKNNSLELIYLNPSFFQQFKIQNGKKIKSASPGDFVDYIKNAECVFTNSFHGTVFSFLFEKKFYVETISNGRKNKRAADFLDMLYLDNNQLDVKTKEEKERIRKEFEKLRKQSIDYLNEVTTN